MRIVSIELFPPRNHRAHDDQNEKLIRAIQEKQFFRFSAPGVIAHGERSREADPHENSREDTIPQHIRSACEKQGEHESDCERTSDLNEVHFPHTLFLRVSHLVGPDSCERHPLVAESRRGVPESADHHPDYCGREHCPKVNKHFLQSIYKLRDLSTNLPIIAKT